jgi:hypothetical protein
MGTRGVFVADTIDYGYVTLVVEFLDPAHLRHQTIGIVDLDDVFLLVLHDRTIVIVERVIVRDERVEIVVASGQLQDDYYRVFLGRGHAIFSFCRFTP